HKPAGLPPPTSAHLAAPARPTARSETSQPPLDRGPIIAAGRRIGVGTQWHACLAIVFLIDLRRIFPRVQWIGTRAIACQQPDSQVHPHPTAFNPWLGFADVREGSGQVTAEAVLRSGVLPAVSLAPLS